MPKREQARPESRAQERSGQKAKTGDGFLVNRSEKARQNFRVSNGFRRRRRKIQKTSEQNRSEAVRKEGDGGRGWSIFIRIPSFSIRKRREKSKRKE